MHKHLKRCTTLVLPKVVLCRHRLIFPGRFQPSIVSTDELNYRVRDGNGWTLIAKNTDYLNYSSRFIVLTLKSMVTRTRFELVLPA